MKILILNNVLHALILIAIFVLMELAKPAIMLFLWIQQLVQLVLALLALQQIV
jgi:hypothetical protein